MSFAMISLIISVLEHGPDAIRQFIELFRRTGMLTQEQATAFNVRLENAFKQPWWQSSAFARPVSLPTSGVSPEVPSTEASEHVAPTLPE